MIFTKLEYLRRFTQAERIAIRTAAAQSPALADYLHLLDLAEIIDTEDLDTVSAVNMLEQSQLIGIGRAQEILGYTESPNPINTEVQYCVYKTDYGYMVSSANETPPESYIKYWTVNSTVAELVRNGASLSDDGTSIVIGGVNGNV